jgi:cytochrome c oxidase cbb3-type subunit III
MIARSALLLFFLLVTGCDLPGQPKIEDKPIRADEIADFNVLFKNNCSGCHGAEGKLGPAPPLNDPLFLALVP